MTVELDIQKTMDEFSSNLKELLDDNLLSVILYGSAVLGDFVPGKGDLDFLVITKEGLKDGDCEKIFTLHDKMRAGEMGQLAIQLEGAYCPLCLVQNPKDSVSRGCYIGTRRKGWKEIYTFCTSPVDFKIIKSYGKIYLGEDIRDKIYNPSMEEIKEYFLNEIQRDITMVDEIKSDGYNISVFQRIPRALCTVLTGQYLSKRQAAIWFESAYSESLWSDLVRHAAQYRFPLSKDELSSVRPEIRERIKEFLVGMEKMIRMLK